LALARAAATGLTSIPAQGRPRRRAAKRVVPRRRTVEYPAIRPGGGEDAERKIDGNIV